LRGVLSRQYIGYDAFEHREKMTKTTEEAYLKSLNKDLHEMELTNYRNENVADITKPFVEKMDIQLDGLSGTKATVFYFNPFILLHYEKNPFLSNERLYPVDLGSPIEKNYFIVIEMLDGMVIDEAPKSTAFSLPNGGGKCLFNVSVTGNKITATFMMSFAKPVYTSEEYHYLREFFARVIQVQQSQFVFKKEK
jgi:hypothetical protein